VDDIFPSEWSPFLLATDVLLGGVAVGFALSRRRGFTSTMSWVLAIVAMPIVGALAYLLLANPVVRRTQRRKSRANEKVRPVAGACEAPDLSALPASARSVLTLATRLTQLRPTGGNRLELLTENRVAFSRIEEAIRGARRFVWAEYYIVNGDETGRRFLELLTERARAGVEVRLLYDAVGCSGMDRDALRALQAAGGKTEEFLPVNPLRRRWAVHLRNHRKILVVDGEVGFTGGMNIGDEYSGSTGRGRLRRKVKPWRDTHMRVRGPALRDLAAIFAEDWCFAADELLELPKVSSCEDGGSVVAAIPSGPDQEHNATGLVFFSGIALATSRCYITSPYFIPDEPTLKALVSAALRGVDVKVLVPRLNDVPMLRPAMRSYYPRLVDAGVEIYEYLPTVLHAKSMVVDQSWCLLGSANLDMRSFRLNFEASLLIHDSQFAVELEQQFERDLQHSVRISKRSIDDRGLLAAVGEGAAQLLSPIL